MGPRGELVLRSPSASHLRAPICLSPPGPARHVRYAAPGDHDGDGFVEDRDGDGRRDVGVGGDDHTGDGSMDDDGWAVEERWHRDTIDAFFQHFDDHFENDPFASSSASVNDPLIASFEVMS